MNTADLDFQQLKALHSQSLRSSPFGMDPPDVAEFLIANPTDQVEYLGGCVECALRNPGPHVHDVMAVVLGSPHKAWFRAKGLAAMLYSRIADDLCMDYRSWSHEKRDGHNYLRLTIEPSDLESEQKIYVWKLTDEIDRQGKTLGVWPD